jgi:predicted AAA+ superfamily ATPase
LIIDVISHTAGNEKYYCTDPGMRSALIRYERRGVGRVPENIVYIEPMRRGCDAAAGARIVSYFILRIPMRRFTELFLTVDRMRCKIRQRCYQSVICFNAFDG